MESMDHKLARGFEIPCGLGMKRSKRQMNLEKAIATNITARLDQIIQDPELVKDIQKRLFSGGFYGGKIDGILGPQTKAAIDNFCTYRYLNNSKTRLYGPTFFFVLDRTSHRTVNPKGLELLKKLEGCKLKAYQDIVAVWTIGFGSTGSHVKPGMIISPEMAERLLKEDLVRFQKAVSESVRVPLSDNEYAALVCFAFNVGVEAFKKSTLLRLLNGESNRKAVANEFLRWNRAGGRVVQGLTNRRMAERDLFLSA